MATRREASGRRDSFSAVLTVFLLFLVVQHAHAYIDPGLGSYSFQLLVAGLMTFLFSVGVLKNKVMSLFRRKSSDTAEKRSSAAQETDGGSTGSQDGAMRRND